VEVFAADVGIERDEGEVVFDYWLGCHCASDFALVCCSL
jgi:hypothetical protein